MRASAFIWGTQRSCFIVSKLPKNINGPKLPKKYFLAPKTFIIKH